MLHSPATTVIQTCSGVKGAWCLAQQRQAHCTLAQPTVQGKDGGDESEEEGLLPGIQGGPVMTSNTVNALMSQAAGGKEDTEEQLLTIASKMGMVRQQVTQDALTTTHRAPRQRGTVTVNQVSPLGIAFKVICCSISRAQCQTSLVGNCPRRG
jgi:hypothetical protein